MIDLTPLDVRKKRGDFKRGLRGYDPEEVDSFLELVAERMEDLVRETLTLGERAERLDEQVRSQEGREKAVNDALVTAQQLREDISGQARQEADTIRSNAEAEAKSMVDRARVEAGYVSRDVEQEIDSALKEAGRRLAEAQEALEGLERNRARFLKSFRVLLEREIDGVEVEAGRSALDLPTLDLDLLGSRTGAELLEAGETATEDSHDGAPGEPETAADADPGEAEPTADADPPEAGAEEGAVPEVDLSDPLDSWTAEDSDEPAEEEDRPDDDSSGELAAELEDLFSGSEAGAPAEGDEDPEVKDRDGAGFRFEDGKDA